MNTENYKEHINSQMLMGPNSLRILEELINMHPLTLCANDIVLDLGCGKGLTSLALAKETGAKIYAADLWVKPEENQKRFDEWGISDSVIAFHEDANKLDFEHDLFSALVSVDAYHYFGTERCFFEEKLLPFMRKGAEVLIGIPGIKDEYASKGKELLSDWLGDEYYMFKSPAEWKSIIGIHESIESVKTWEMSCFDSAWNEWFMSGHEYALGDKRFFETLIKPYTCFVGISIKLK